MARSGRKRKGGKREPSGRLKTPTRVERRENAQNVAHEARSRIYGLSKEQAKAMPETTWLGRLAVQGKDAGGISRTEYEAATTYRGIMQDYDRLHPVRGFPTAGALDRSGSHDDSDGNDPEYVRRFQRVVGLRERAADALRSANAEDFRSWQVVDNVVLKGFEMPHMIEPLRIGLQKLAQALRVPEYEPKPEEEAAA